MSRQRKLPSFEKRHIKAPSNIDKNNKKQLAEILTKLDVICEVVENLKKENNTDIVVVANKDDDYMVKIPEFPQWETLLLLEQKEFVRMKENPPHIEKMNDNYDFDFDFKKCDNCPLFKVPDNLVDNKFLKIVSKYDGYLIVYGAILFTFENGYIKNNK